MYHSILDWWRHSILRMVFWWSLWTFGIYKIEPRLWWYPSVLLILIYLLDKKDGRLD